MSLFLELLIDDGGEVWPLRPGSIPQRVGGPSRAQSGGIHRAIALGFVFIGRGEAGLRVALRPQFVSQRTLCRLELLIAQWNPPRVALAADHSMSRWQLVVGADRAICMIGHLIDQARRPEPKALLHATRLGLEHCDRVASGQFLPVLQAWRERHGRWDPDFYGLLEQKGLLATTAISHQPRGSDRLLIEHWGKKIRTYGDAWIKIARGRDFEDQPSADIGHWDTTRVRETIAERRPTLMRPDFAFRALDGSLTRVTFYRLALPWRLPDGGVNLTAVTLKRQMVVLERPSG